ncbi:MAG: hypothetical protein JWQ72_804 [Polaromonas sp.]|nr:hypothetical protein [Polaromonas sp.]
MDIQVEYDAGTVGEPQPAWVWFGSRRVQVRAVVDRWYGADCVWWKLDTEDGPYVLRRGDTTGTWELAAVPRA